MWADWRKKAEGTGLIPVTLLRNVKWVVCGINSKYSTDQRLNEKLSYFWIKWLEQSTDEVVPKLLKSGSL